MANINISDLRPADSASYLNDLTEEEILYVEGGFWFIPAAIAAAKAAAPAVIAAGKVAGKVAAPAVAKLVGSAVASGAIGWGLGKVREWWGWG